MRLGAEQGRAHGGRAQPQQHAAAPDAPAVPPLWPLTWSAPACLPAWARRQRAQCWSWPRLSQADTLTAGVLSASTSEGMLRRWVQHGLSASRSVSSQKRAAPPSACAGPAGWVQQLGASPQAAAALGQEGPDDGSILTPFSRPLSSFAGAWAQQGQEAPRCGRGGPASV